eukprot:8772880-Lingulodinium_polyedra.AAC.1
MPVPSKSDRRTIFRPLSGTASGSAASRPSPCTHWPISVQFSMHRATSPASPAMALCTAAVV